jgi:four helix bundle protein
MDYQNTRIHQKSIELIQHVAVVLKAMPPGHSDLANQLRRASSSIALNFAEGCGRSSEKDRRRFFTCALGSAKEAAMIFDVARAFGAIDDEARRQGNALCDQLGGMLYKFR